METYRGHIIVACVGLYMVLCIGVGIWALRRTKSTEDFFMAGRQLGVFVTGLAVFSSTLSGFGFVGGPGLVYSMGMSSVWMIVCSAIGFSLSFFLLGKRIRLFAELRDTVSLPDAVAARYNSELGRFLTGLAILLGVIGYLATQIKAMATVLHDILANVAFIPDLSIAACTAISVAVLVFYCVTGGIIASVYTDLVQGAIMVVAAVLVFIAAVTAFDGGVAGISTAIMRDDPEAIGPWGTLGMFGCLSWFFIFAIGGSGQPHVITKLMMNKKIRDARHILPVSAVGYGVSAVLWISIGLVMRALVVEGLHPELAHPDAAASQFLQHYAHPLLAGIVFAGLFAAIMSTADAFLNIGAAAVIHDIPKSIIGRSIKNELFWARVATVVIAVGAALFVSISNQELVALLGAFGWSTFAAAIVPAVSIGFNWKRATGLAANAAIVSSLLINFGVEFFKISIPYSINPGALSLLVSLTVFFTISFLSKPQKIDPDIEAIMDM